MVNGSRDIGNQTVNRISGHIMLALLLFAVLLVGGAPILMILGIFNPPLDGDEGAAARLFQLAIALLIPASITFLVINEKDIRSGL